MLIRFFSVPGTLSLETKVLSSNISGPVFLNRKLSISQKLSADYLSAYVLPASSKNFLLFIINIVFALSVLIYFCC